MSNKKEWALYHAAQGFHVFRLIADGKTPLKSGWQAEATNDAERVAQLWDEEPDANIGAFTSKFDDGRALVVVDVDNKNGHDGDATVFDLELAGFDFPVTAANRTPTGGRHYIYATDRPVKQGAGLLGDGLDIRSRGGYIVMAGSTIGGEPYEWQDDPVAPAPAWLLEKLRAETRTERKNVDVTKIDQDRALARAQKIIDDAPLPEEGSRNETAFRIACDIKDQGVDQDTCLALMTEWNALLDEPIEDEELETTIWSAYKNGQEGVGSKAPDTVFSPVLKKQLTIAPKTEHPFDLMNQEYAFVVTGSSFMIVHTTLDVDGNRHFQFLNENTFHKYLASKEININSKSMALSKAWMEWPGRKSYDGITYRPGIDVGSRYLNLWNGFAVEPFKEGDEISDEDIEAFQLYLEHGNLNMFANTDAGWGWAWMAHCIQFPDVKKHTAQVFRGDKGVGKNSFVEPFMALFGEHGMLADSSRYLTSNFNSHFEKLSLFVSDEGFWAGQKDQEGRLKGLISGAKHLIERKGLEPISVPNRTNLIILGNEGWLIPATSDERRYHVCDVATHWQRHNAKFAKIAKSAKSGGLLRLLMAYLLQYDISGYDLNTAPATKALVDQKHASLPPFENFLYDCLHANALLNSPAHNVTLDCIPVSAFKLAFQAYTRSRNIRARLPDEHTMAKLLKKILPSMTARNVRVSSETVYSYVSPGINQLRRDWENYIGAVDGIDWTVINQEENECLT